METRNMVLLDIDYVTQDSKPVIRLFGKDKGSNDNNTIIALDKTFEPYIYVIPYDIGLCQHELENLGLDKIERIQKKDLGQNKEILKVTLKHPQDVPELRDDIWNLSQVKEIREHDIPFYRRYLIDKGIFPMSQIKIEGNIIESSPCVFSASENTLLLEIEKPPQKLESDFPELKILSFDIEVRNPDGMPNAEKDEIIMVGISGNMGLDKVISTKGQHLDFVEKVNTEKKILEKFAEIVKNYQPDVIVGYNSDNFDFPYIKDRAKLLGVKLDLGVDGSELKFLRRGFANSASIKGIIHVDLYLVMRRYMHLDRYTLERVYQELFGEEKFDLPGDKLWQYWDAGGESLEQLIRYSLDDVQATYKIGEKILPLNLELSRIVGQPFFDLTRMTTGQQAEWFFMRKSHEYGEIAPNKPSHLQHSQRRGKSVEGGYVKEPEKGLHENIVQFDFRSLYPSIIISKNISPDTITLDEENSYIAPESGYKFLKEPPGFIPSVIGQVLDERSRLKRKMQKSEDPMEKKILNVQQEALKRLANTMYGVYGYSRFRWYSIECAEAITAWGRDYIKKTMEKAKKFGFHSIYADTDGFYATYHPEEKEK